MSKIKEVCWLSDVEAHDYPAAKAYLDLIYDNDFVHSIIRKLKNATIVEFKAKDIFRASGLSLLGVSNSHVAKNLKKIENGIKLSPILLMRDSNNGKVVICDGYHRVCASYQYNEDCLIPCKIA